MRPDAIITTGDALHQLHLQQIIHFAIKSRLPAVCQLKENVDAGCLMSYGRIFATCIVVEPATWTGS
jgi:ABC-type uncharacterized transport system substrate-binding protein